MARQVVLMLKVVAKVERLMLAVLMVMAKAKAVAEWAGLMLGMVMWQVVQMLKVVAKVAQMVQAKVAKVALQEEVVDLLGVREIPMQRLKKKTNALLIVWITARPNFGLR